MAEAKAKKENAKPAAKKEAAAKKAAPKAKEAKPAMEQKKAEPKAEAAPVVVSATDKDIEQKLEEMGMLKYALITEKAVNMIEAENKIVFVVDSMADKAKVRKAVEDLYKVKVSKVNIIRDQKGRKKAIVRIDKKFKAGDVATKLGVV